MKKQIGILTIVIITFFQITAPRKFTCCFYCCTGSRKSSIVSITDISKTQNPKKNTNLMNMESRIKKLSDQCNILKNRLHYQLPQQTSEEKEEWTQRLIKDQTRVHNKIEETSAEIHQHLKQVDAVRDVFHSDEMDRNKEVLTQLQVTITELAAKSNVILQKLNDQASNISTSIFIIPLNEATPEQSSSSAVTMPHFNFGSFSATSQEKWFPTDLPNSED